MNASDFVAQVAPADSAPLDALGALYDLRQSIRATMRETVAAARANGETWQTIADALGISRQAAWERFGKPE